MCARVATFEGDPSQADQAIEFVRSQQEQDSPPAVLEAAKGFLMLVHRQSGKGSASPSSTPRTTSVEPTRP